MQIPKFKTNQKINPILFEQILNEASPEMAKTLTLEQMEALHQIFKNREWQNHPVDIRISVRIPILPFYLVFLAGEERRSKQSRQYERHLYPFWTLGNIFILIILANIIIFSTIAIGISVIPLIHTQLNSTFPTSIPWIKNQKDCERSDRIWENEKCWDYEHSPNF